MSVFYLIVEVYSSFLLYVGLEALRYKSSLCAHFSQYVGYFRLVNSFGHQTLHDMYRLFF